ncbi:Histamine oxidase [Phytophthora cinnamomi]|uniref:Histamine oxidase n=1 Tax=Phytophthora cinnamomi TaxID=4785 RepID=UPI00355A726F|nr:Histamine oxidase [Phytophthora cinnamomi]
MSSQAPAPVLNEAVFHPLDPITAKEVQTLKEVVGKAGYGGPSFRYSYVMLREPDHATLKEFKSGDAIPREIGALLLNLDDNVAREMVVDIPARKIVHERKLDPAVEGWSPIMDEDYVAAENILKAYPDYLDALKKRGISDASQVRCLPLSAGVYGYEDEIGCRMIRVLSFLASENTHSMFAHPIDGIVAHIDLTNHRVARLIDTGYSHVPMESGDYLDPKVTGPMRTSMKPLHITQPDGASFTIKNHVLDWEKWEIRVGFNGREGLTLHDISFNDNGLKRPILNRASVSEMVVPYGRPEPTHDWQNYFDVGEYQFGRLANSLVLGCDCLGKIQYLDAVVVDDFGEPALLKNVVCIHEEDYGTLWKHTDVYTSTGTVRRQRRLVISFFTTVVNYDSVAKRAIFASKHLWVTQYARDEMWAAGYTPNQNPGFAGLPAYTKSNRSVDGEDIVLWHTFGLTHFPRPEDWPIMPVDYAKFTLRPEGFFDRNPTLDVPEDPNGREHSQKCCP